MATEIWTELIDDIDGSPATQTIRFSVDGEHYEIDLNESHAEQLRAAFAPYILHGRLTQPIQQGARLWSDHAGLNRPLAQQIKAAAVLARRAV